MVRRATGVQVDPTPEEIRQETAEIRRRWTPNERARRLCFKPLAWLPPMVLTGEVPELQSEPDAA